MSKKETLLLSDRNQVDDLWWNKVFILLSSPLLVKQKGTEPKCFIHELTTDFKLTAEVAVSFIKTDLVLCFFFFNL